ncbi:MAG TPA: exonuclease domain-containing protein [Streptosporangiaceae bacterium]|nr:exonuclease domain-containing protein [Streptosporangiaceae bacterium]
MTKLCFIDCETTGTDPARHDLWEIAVITRDDSDPCEDQEFTWLIRPDLAAADPGALRVNRYYQRLAGLPVPKWSEPAYAARTVASLTAGTMIVAANPAFDAGFLDVFLRKNGQCPAWDYHLRDIGSMVAGWVHGCRRGVTGGVWRQLPASPKLADAARVMGIDPGLYEAHTALGDARLVKAVYDAVTGGAA